MPPARTCLYMPRRDFIGRTDTVRDGDAHAEDRAAQRARWSSVTTTYKLQRGALALRACARARAGRPLHAARSGRRQDPYSSLKITQ